MFKKINSLVGVFLKNKNVQKNPEREIVEKVWEKEIDTKTQKNTTIVGFKNGELLIKASNPTWRLELSLIAKEIKKKLTKKQKTK